MESIDSKRPKLYLSCPKCNLQLVRAQFCPFDGAQLEKIDQGVSKETKTPQRQNSRCPVNVRTWDMVSKPIYCPNCDQGWSAKLTFCPDDGTRLGGEQIKKRCPACRDLFTVVAAQGLKSRICPKDGTLLVSVEETRNFNERYAGAVLQTKQHQYEVVKAIAAGSNSLMLRAVEVSDSDRPVAIKVLTTSLSDPQLARKAQRFVGQVEAYKNLKHANIVSLLDSGQTSEGRPYLVFDLVSGEMSLDRLHGQFAELPPQYFVEVVSGICAGLQFAHEQGVFHFDLAPNVVLIEGTADDGIQVRVTDFSKGAPLIHGDNRKQQLTEMGDIFGHPEYMSPEACHGQTVDARSNVFSLGCLMYTMLSEVNPFEAAHWGAVLLKKLHEQAPPLPTIAAQPGLTENIDALIRKCLEQKPEQRYQSAAALSEALHALPLTPSEEPVAYSKLSQLHQKRRYANKTTLWPAL